MKYISYCLLFIFLVACHKKHVAKAPPVPVTAMHIVPETIPANFEYVGVAKSSHIVELRARVEGYLESIDYLEGSLVKAGDPMFVIDQRPFQAALEMSQGELLRQKAILWNAQQIKNRMVPLYEDNAVSQKDLDDAIAGEMSALAAVAVANANVQNAEINLGFTKIQSPVTGMASFAKFRQGALISPGANSLLTDIYVIDPIWIYFNVSVGDLIKTRTESEKGTLTLPPNNGFKIEVVLSDGSILPAEGKIDFTSPSLQQSTGTMQTRAVLSNPQGWLFPGEFVRVVVKGAERPNAIIIPQAAVMQGLHGIFVYVVDENSEAAIRPIELGDWYENYWVVQSGLKAGDIVITQGTNRVENNTPVVVKNWAPKKTPSQTTGL